MPTEAGSSAIYRPDLGMAVMEYYEGPTMGLIGTEIMPIFPVPDQAATYPVIPKEALLKLPDTSRAMRGRYNRGDWNWEDGLYATKEQGWEEPIDDRERRLLDRRVPGASDLMATMRAMRIIMKRQEYRISSLLFNASNFTAHAVTDEWDDDANAKPVNDVNDGVISFRSACGMIPDALVISFYTFTQLKECQQIIDRLKHTFPGLDINRMNSEQLAAVFNVPRVLVGGAIYDSAKAGAAATITDMWNQEYAALVKIARRGEFVEPGVGFTFLWEEDSPTNPVVEEYREEGTRSDVIRVRHDVSESLMQSKDSTGTVVSNIAAACVYLFSNVST